MGRVLGKWRLPGHDDNGQNVFTVGSKVTRLGHDVLKFEYIVMGACNGLRIPEQRLGERTDQLWVHTCFEAFLAPQKSSYVEYNFSPSSQWATYQFEGYRDGMMPLFEQSQPDIFLVRDDSRIALTAFVELPPILRNRPLQLALSAVLEEADSTKSYWALAHPPGKPDFHHPTCFAATLPAPPIA